MARIGLVYEDVAIRIVFEALAPKVLGQAVEVEGRMGRSWPGVLGQLPNLLQILSVAHISAPLDCVMVVVDANGEGSARREQRLINKIGNRQFRFGSPKCHAIERQSETWLLADSQAINAAAGTRIPAVNDPESLLDPKRHLIQVLHNHNGSPYNRRFVRAAAEVADLNTIAGKCPGFQDFARKLRECQVEGV